MCTDNHSRKGELSVIYDSKLYNFYHFTLPFGTLIHFIADLSKKRQIQHIQCISLKAYFYLKDHFK